MVLSFALVCILGLFSILWKHNKAIALFLLVAVYSSCYPKLTGLNMNLICILLGCGWYLFWLGKKELFLNVVCILGVAHTSLVISQYFGYDPIFNLTEPSFLYVPEGDPAKILNGANKDVGFFVNRNFASAFIAVCFPAFLRKKWFWFIPALIFGLIITQSTGPVLAIVISMTFAIAWLLKNDFPMLSNESGSGAVGGVLFLLFSGVLGLGWSQSVFDRITVIVGVCFLLIAIISFYVLTRKYLSGDLSENRAAAILCLILMFFFIVGYSFIDRPGYGRWEDWKLFSQLEYGESGKLQIGDGLPIEGLGLGAFRNSRIMLHNQWYTHVHNDFLEGLIEMGWMFFPVCILFFYNVLMRFRFDLLAGMGVVTAMLISGVSYPMHIAPIAAVSVGWLSTLDYQSQLSRNTNHARSN